MNAGPWTLSAMLSQMIAGSRQRRSKNLPDGGVKAVHSSGVILLSRAM